MRIRPFPIEQRDRSIRALGDYETLAVSLSRGDGSPTIAAALAEFTRSASELGAVANVHTRGDLFIDEGAATLSSLAAGLKAASNQAGMSRIVARAEPSIAKMIGIVRDDVVARQRDALSATRREGDLWVAYYNDTSNGTARMRLRTTVPPCSEPVIPDPDAPLPDAPKSPIAMNVLPPRILSGYTAAEDRSAALAALNMNGVFSALLDLNEAAAQKPSAVDAARHQLSEAIVEPQRDALPLLDALKTPRRL